MPFNSHGGIYYFKFESFDHPDITHAIFTRRGGISPDPWKSLNVGGYLGDDPSRVAWNRECAFRAVGRNPASMYDVWQVHSEQVVCVDSPRPWEVPHLQADAMLTNNPEVTLFMRFADCVPVFLFDPIKQVIGLVHSGWLGTVKKIAVKAIEAMVQNYGCQVENIQAGIGPSICVDHYEIGPEVVQQVLERLGEDGDQFLWRVNQTVKFDLWAANQRLMAQAGIKKIEVCGLCTACQIEDWYSHRGESGKTGRFGALIGLTGNYQ